MADVCPCHGEPWLIRKRSPGSTRRNPQRMCPVKRRERQRAASLKYIRQHPERKRASSRATERAARAARHALRDARDKKLGKLLNLSVHGATEHERLLARQMYNRLKARTTVA